MTINSMTGFAREAGTTGSLSWAWELKSVNGRGLEVRVRVPPGFDASGEEARRLVAGAFSRGQCQLNLTISHSPTSARVRVNRQALEALVAALGTMTLPDEIRPASLDGILAVRGVVEIEDEGADRLKRRRCGESSRPGQDAGESSRCGTGERRGSPA
jgi:uncharacterized protein (TIGR00255 family)